MAQQRIRGMRSRRDTVKKRPAKRPKTRRWDVCNFLIAKYGYTKYLEIGVRRNDCFDRVRCETKHGIDPFCDTTFNMTSDEFFENVKGRYDIIFIDGWHSEEQVDRDIIGALSRLNVGGTIILHDTEPMKESAAGNIPPGPVVRGAYGGEGGWHGGVWRSFIKLRCTKPNLFMCVIRCDCGIGIIRPMKGVNNLYEDAPLEVCLTWEYFNEHRIALLNGYKPEAMSGVL